MQKNNLLEFMRFLGDDLSYFFNHESSYVTDGVILRPMRGVRELDENNVSEHAQEHEVGNLKKYNKFSVNT